MREGGREGRREGGREGRREGGREGRREGGGLQGVCEGGRYKDIRDRCQGRGNVEG